jgi:hypothetical protein
LRFPPFTLNGASRSVFCLRPRFARITSASIGQGIKRTIVPPEQYFRLTISALGYKTWIYRDPSDPSRPALIRFQPGEEKELLVELKPQAPAAR